MNIFITNAPTMIVLGGLFFILLGLAKHKKIEPYPGRQKYLILFGFIVLFIGCFLYLLVTISTDEKYNQDELVQPETNVGTETKVETQAEVETEAETEKLTPSAEIDDVWFEDNIMENSVRGVRTHMTLRTYNLKDEQCEIYEYFYFSDGSAVLDLNQRYGTLDGRASSMGYHSPLYESNTCDDFYLFIPYAELHLPTNTYYKLNTKVVIYYKGKELAESDWVPYQVTIS